MIRSDEISVAWMGFNGQFTNPHGDLTMSFLEAVKKSIQGKSSPGRKQVGTIRGGDLPNDLAVLILQWVDEFNDSKEAERLWKEFDDLVFPVYEVPVDAFNHDVEMDPERGPEHAREMDIDQLPPVVIAKGVWLDGRHRVFKAKEDGRKTIKAMDVGSIMPLLDPKKHQIMGVLKEGYIRPHHELSKHENDKYIVHVTRESNLGSIKKNGLVPQKPPADYSGKGKNSWMDGGSEPRVFFGPDIYFTAIHASKFKNDGVILRVPKEVAEDEVGVELWTTKTVSPSQIEVLTDDGWKPLEDTGANENNHSDLVHECVEEAEAYQTGHTAPTKESGAPLWDVTRNGTYPDDFYGPRGREYAYGDRAMADLGMVQGYRNKPNRQVVIYRAVSADLPKEKRKINKGDWVSLNRAYAVEHGKSNLGNNYKILTKTVFARDVFTSGDSLEEWGYDPQPKLGDTDIYSPEDLKKVQASRQEKRAKAKAEREQGLKDWLEKKMPKQRNGMVHLWVVAYHPYDPNNGISAADQIFVDEDEAEEALTRHKVLYSAWFPMDALEYSRVRRTVKQVHGAKIHVDKVVEEGFDPGDFDEVYDDEPIVMEKDGIRYAVDSKKHPGAAMAFDGEKKVGFLLTDKEYDTPDGTLLSISNTRVLGDYQRRGIAKNMYRVLLKAMADSGEYAGLFSCDASVCNANIYGIRSAVGFSPYTIDGEEEGEVAWASKNALREHLLGEDLAEEDDLPGGYEFRGFHCQQKERNPRRDDIIDKKYFARGGVEIIDSLEHKDRMEAMEKGWFDLDFSQIDNDSEVEEAASELEDFLHDRGYRWIFVSENKPLSNYGDRCYKVYFRREDIVGEMHDIMADDTAMAYVYKVDKQPKTIEVIDENLAEARGIRLEWGKKLDDLFQKWAANPSQRAEIEKEIDEYQKQIDGWQAEADRKMKAGLDHEVRQEDFVDFHKTGHIRPEAYTDANTARYLDEFYSGADNKRKLKLVQTLDTPNGKIEIMERVEKNSYFSRDKDGEIKRHKNGDPVIMTDEEIQKAGKLTHAYDYFAYDGDTAVGYVADDFGVPGVHVRKSHQRLGIGLALVKAWMSKRKDTQILGQMTDQGMKLAAAYHRDKVKAALAAGKKVPAEVLQDYPELKKMQSESTMDDIESRIWATPENTGGQYYTASLKTGSTPPKVGDVLQSEKYGTLVVSGVDTPESMASGRGGSIAKSMRKNDIAYRVNFLPEGHEWLEKILEHERKLAEAVNKDSWIGPLYHGSTQKGLKKLDPSKAGTGAVEYGARGPVAWFTDNKESALFFTGKEGEEAEARVYKAYVKMSNPMDVDVSEELNGSPALWLDDAKNEGHDGLIVRNTEDPYPSTVYAVWDASQIRLEGPLEESVTTIDGDLERDDVMSVLVNHAKKHHERLYPDQSDEEALEMGMDPGMGGGAYFQSKKEMDEKVDCVFDRLSKLPDPIPVWRVLRLDPDMAYYNANTGFHWSFSKESALKLGKDWKATHIVNGEVRKRSVNWIKTIERNLIFSCNGPGEGSDEENEIYAPANKVKAKKIEALSGTKESAVVEAVRKSITYRGVQKDGSTRNKGLLGKGLYSTSSREEAENYIGDDGQGKILKLKNAIPKKPLVLDGWTQWDRWLTDEAIKLKLPEAGRIPSWACFERAGVDIADHVRSLGYDGVQIGKGENVDYVLYSRDGKPVDVKKHIVESSDEDALADLRRRAHLATGKEKQVLHSYADELERKLGQKAKGVLSKKIDGLDVRYSPKVDPDSDHDYDQTFIIYDGQLYSVHDNIGHDELIYNIFRKTGIDIGSYSENDISGRRTGNTIWIWGEVTPSVAKDIKKHFPDVKVVWQARPFKRKRSTLAENFSLKPNASPRQTAVQPLVYLALEEKMARAYAAGYVQNAHAMRPSRPDGVIFTIEMDDQLREAGGDVWQAYKDDLKEGAENWLDGEKDDSLAQDFQRFVENVTQDEDVDTMAELASKDPDGLLAYMDPMSWMCFQMQEQGYAELAVKEVPWKNIISIKEYDDGVLTHVTRGGSKEDEDGEYVVYHGAPLDHWEAILEKLPGRKAVGKKVSESVMIEASRKGSSLTTYHGTSSKFLPLIKRNGLKDPYLASTRSLAQYYAEEVVAEHGGSMVVLQVEVKDFSKLRYDGASMDEPVMADDEERDAQWEKAAREHPNWIKDGMIVIPARAWKYSWDGVGAVYYKGTIAPEHIEFGYNRGFHEDTKPTSGTMSSDEMLEWIIDNHLKDSWGNIDEVDAYEISRKASTWRLKDIPVKDLEESAPGSIPARRGRRNLPIIALKFDEGQYEVLDGRHRIAEHRHAKKETIKAWVADFSVKESQEVGAFLLEARTTEVKGVVLYHGTQKKFVPGIMKHGLRKTVGWGEAGSQGVFLSGSIEGAMYWAKMSRASANGEDMEPSRIDEKGLQVLQVTIPEDQLDKLKADMEQAGDFAYPDNEEDNWKLSLEKIGDVRFDGEVPPSWIKKVNSATDKKQPSDDSKKKEQSLVARVKELHKELANTPDKKIIKALELKRQPNAEYTDDDIDLFLRFHKLIEGTMAEARVEDVRSKGFNEFLEKYSNRMPKGLRKKDLFVRFTRSAENKIVPITDAHHDPTAVYAYPLEFVVNNPMEVTYGSNMDWLHVLRVKSAAVLELQGMTERHVVDLLNKAGASISLFKKKRNEFKRNPPHDMFAGRLTSPMGLAFMYAMQHRDESNPNELLSGPEQRRRFLKTGYDAVRDNAKSKGGSIINIAEPQQIFFLTKESYDVVDKFYIGNGKSVTRKGSKTEIEYLIKKMVASIASKLGERKIVWQEDNPNLHYYKWDAYQSWIGDDYLFLAHVEIDPTFKDKEGMFRAPRYRERGHADVHRFVVELVGPKGSVKVPYDRHATVDFISNDIVKKYNESPDKSRTIDGLRKLDFDIKAKQAADASRKKDKEEKTIEAERFVKAAKYFGVDIPIEAASTMEDSINNAIMQTAIHRKKQPFDAHKIDRDYYEFLLKHDNIGSLDYKEFNKLAETLYDKVVEFMEKHDRMASSWKWMSKSFANGENPFEESSAIVGGSLVVEASKLTGYTFRIQNGTDENDIVIFAYKGQQKAGHIQALKTTGDQTKPECHSDIAKAKKAIGREDLKIFQVWKSHVFTQEERGEEHRGIGVGAALYAKMIEEAGKRGGIVIASDCASIGCTSTQAKRIWDNSKTIRDMAHVFGHVAAWKGMSGLTDKDIGKGYAMRSMESRWSKTPVYLRSKDEFRDWGTRLAEYDPDWVEEFLKGKRDKPGRKRLQESSLVEAARSFETATWGQLMAVLKPESWVAEQMGDDDMVVIRPLAHAKMARLTTARGDYSIKDAFEEFAEPWQKRLVTRYRKIVGTKGFHGLENVVILDGDRVLDGHHRLIASMLENKASLRYVDIGEGPGNVKESRKPPVKLAKLAEYTFKTSKGSENDKIIINAYRGKERVGWIEAIMLLPKEKISNACEKDIDRAKIKVGKDDIDIFYVNVSYVAKNEATDNHRGIGLGAAMYAKMIEEVGKRGALLVAGKCVKTSNTSKDAEKIWKHSTTIRNVAHVFGHVAAWKGLADLTDDDKAKMDRKMKQGATGKSALIEASESTGHNTNLSEEVSITSWGSYGKDDLTVSINGRKERWEWLVDSGRAEIVEKVESAESIKQALHILRQYAQPKKAMKPAPKQRWDGPRCPECGTPHGKGASKCPNCDEIIHEVNKWSTSNKDLLADLRAEAKKYNTFDAFKKAFSIDIKHGTYWHVTSDPKFSIDPTKGPRDMSSLSSGNDVSSGKLMITSDLDWWLDYYSKKSRPYVAKIDMSDVPANAYWQVNRGFGNEFWVEDPSKAKVVKVMPRDTAKRLDAKIRASLPKSDHELRRIWRKVHKKGNDEIVTEAKEQDILDATHRLENAGLTDKFWKAFNINSNLYHNKRQRLGSSEEETVAYAGKVSEVLIPDVLKHVAKSAHDVPVYVTYRIDGDAVYGKWNGKYAIFVRPGARAWILWYLLHEIKHAIDGASGKETLKDPDLSNPDSFKTYKAHPSERRAEAFAKRVIMRAAPDKKPSLIEAAKLITKSREAGHSAEHLGVFGWFDVYSTPKMAASLKKKLSPVAMDATRQLGKLGFSRQRRIVVVNELGKDGVNHITGIKGGISGYADAKNHGIWILPKEYSVDLLVHEWLHMFFEELPKATKEKWRKFWEQHVHDPAVDTVYPTTGDTVSKKLKEELDKISKSKNLQGLYHITDAFEKRSSFIPAVVHGLMRDTSGDDLREKIARVAAIGVFGGQPETKLIKNIEGPKRYSGTKDRGYRGDDVDIIYNGGTWFITNEKKTRSVVNAKRFMETQSPLDVAEVVDLEALRQSMAEHIKNVPKIQEFIDILMERTKSPEGFGGTFFALKKTKPNQLKEMVGEMAGCLIEHLVAKVIDEKRDREIYQSQTGYNFRSHYELDVEAVIKDWEELINTTESGTGKGTNGALLQAIAQNIDISKLADGIAKFNASNRGQTKERIGKPEGAEMRLKAAEKGLTARSYGAANPDELWTTTGEALARGEKVPPRIKKAFLNVIQGIDPMNESALIEAARLVSEAVSIHKLGDDYVERLKKDLNTLLSNVAKVENADEISEYFTAVHRFRDRLELMTGPYSSWVRGLTIDKTPLRKLFYRLDKRDQISNFGSWYTRALYDLLHELNSKARWDPKEGKESYAEFWWREEKDKWKARVQRRARKLWKNLKAAFQSFDVEGERVRVPEEDVEEIHGHPTVIIGYDQDEARHKKSMEGIKEGIKKAKDVIGRRFPSLLPRSLPIVINFNSSVDVAGTYLHAFGGPNAPAIEISAYQDEPKRAESVIIHEAAHYYWTHRLKEEARERWREIYKANMSGRLNLAKVKRYWDENPNMKWIHDVVDDTSMKVDDPHLYLQLRYLLNNSRRTDFDIRQRPDLEQAIKDKKVWVVPKQPVTWYAGKNAQELFCESVATYLGFGDRAMPDFILAVLKDIIGSPLKEGCLTEAYRGLSFEDDAGSIEGYETEADGPNFRNWITNLLGDKGGPIADYVKKNASTVAVLKNMHVDEDSRGQGIGSDLMDKFMENTKADMVFLEADQEEEQAPGFSLVKWYESYDFETFADASGNPVMVYPSEHAEALKALKETTLFEGILCEARFDNLSTSLTRKIVKGLKTSMDDHVTLKYKVKGPAPLTYIRVEADLDEDNEKFHIEGRPEKSGLGNIGIAINMTMPKYWRLSLEDIIPKIKGAIAKEIDRFMEVSSKRKGETGGYLHPVELQGVLAGIMKEAKTRKVSFATVLDEKIEEAKRQDREERTGSSAKRNKRWADIRQEILAAARMRFPQMVKESTGSVVEDVSIGAFMLHPELLSGRKGVSNVVESKGASDALEAIMDYKHDPSPWGKQIETVQKLLGDDHPITQRSQEILRKKFGANVTVYRGGEDVSGDSPAGWTTDPDIAIRFALDDRGEVCKGTVKTSDVLYYDQAIDTRMSGTGVSMHEDEIILKAGAKVNIAKCVDVSDEAEEHDPGNYPSDEHLDTINNRLGESAITESVELPGEAEEYISGGCGLFAVALARAYGYKLGVWRDVESGRNYVAHIYAINAQGKPVDVSGVWPSEEEMAEEIHGIWGTYSDEYSFDELDGEQDVKAFNDEIMACKWDEQLLKKLVAYVKDHPKVYGPGASNNAHMHLLESEEVETLKVPRLKQKYDHDCGVAVLRAIIKMKGFDIDQDELVDIVAPSKENGTSAKKLFTMIKKVDPSARLLKNPSIKQLRSMIAERTPVVTCMQAYNDGHWVIVTGVDDKYVHLHDPYVGGTRKVSINDLDERWKSEEEQEGRVAIQLSISTTVSKARSKPLKD